MRTRCNATFDDKYEHAVVYLSFLIESICDRICSTPNVVILRASSILFSVISIIYKARIGCKKKSGTSISNLLFPLIFLAMQHLLGKYQGRGTLAVALALTENSNVAQTLGAHLRRKRVAVTSSWIKDGRVNQSLVAFSRCCIPRYILICETKCERGFCLDWREIPAFEKICYSCKIIYVK